MTTKTRNASKTAKITPDTSAPAQTETPADVSAPAAAPAAVEAAAPAPVEVETPIVAAVEEAPLAGAVEGEAFGDFLPPSEEETVATHTISAVPEKGFCRAGKRWHREPTYVNRADWDDEKWQALTNEPNLVVRELAQ